MLSYALNLAEEKRKHPGNDIATKLLNSEIDGDHLTQAEYSFFFLLLINAGGDTTRNLLSGGMLALFNNHEQRRRLHHGPLRYGIVGALLSRRARSRSLRATRR
jgi:cytochrome P450